MKETTTKLWLKVVSSIKPWSRCWSQMPLLPAIFFVSVNGAFHCLAYVTLRVLGGTPSGTMSESAESLKSKSYKRCWNISLTILSSPTQLIFQHFSETFKCLTSIPFVSQILTAGVTRALVPTTIVPSLVAIGNFFNNYRMYQLYLCAMY